MGLKAYPSKIPTAKGPNWDREASDRRMIGQSVDRQTVSLVTIRRNDRMGERAKETVSARFTFTSKKLTKSNDPTRNQNKQITR